MTIEAILLIPTYYRKEQALLKQCEEISAAAAKAIPLLSLQGASEETILDTIATLEDEPSILGGALYVTTDDMRRLVGTFGKPPILTLADMQEPQMMRVRSQNGDRYDVSWVLESADQEYTLVIHHDTSAVQRQLYLYLLGLLGLIVIIAGFVTLATFLGLERMIVRAILALRNDLLMVGDAIQQDGKAAQFQSLQFQRRDELGEVMTAFEQMFQRVTQEIAERQQAEQSLRESEQQVRLSLQRENLLNQLATEIRNSLDLDLVLATAVTAIRQLLQVDRCQFMWFCPNTGREPCDFELKGAFWNVVTESKADSRASILGQYAIDPAIDVQELQARLATASVLRCDRTHPANTSLLQSVTPIGQWNALLAIPIQTRSGAMGLLQCSHHCSERIWQEDEVELIQAVADQLAIAISQAELYAQTREAQESAEKLLLNILPEEIAERLRQDTHCIADRFESVTILFADIVDFTGLAAQIPPTELVNLLNQIFSTFDNLAEHYGLEKIKTIGDAYMVVGGLPKQRQDHAESIAEMAIAMQQAVQELNRPDGQPFAIRIGISTGPVVAGVIGLKKFIYDLWGDAVNTASRMESHGTAGGIQVTAATYELLQDQYVFEPRGEIAIKGKGKMHTYWLRGKTAKQPSPKTAAADNPAQSQSPAAVPLLES
ncbi:MAG: adenylate/guanylate cyclase domain-containing protein [Thainema sp.]